MGGLFVRKAQSMCGTLSQVSREVKQRREENAGQEAARNEGKLKGQKWGRKAVCLDVWCADEGDLLFSSAHYQPAADSRKPSLPSFESN